MWRKLRIGLEVAGWISLILFLPGVPDALTGWRRWLGWAHVLNADAARWLLLIFGVSVVVGAHYPKRWMWWRKPHPHARLIAAGREIGARLRAMADEVDGGPMDFHTLEQLPEAEQERRRRTHTELGTNFGRARQWRVTEMYLSALREPTIRTRNELLALLAIPPRNRMLGIEHAYDNPTNPIGYRMVAADLELLAAAVEGGAD